MKRLLTQRKSILAIFFVLFFTMGLLVYPKIVKSGSLTAAKDTLETSRLSYDASIDTTIASGETLITIDTGSVDDNTSHLFPGDVICFQNGAETGCKGNTTYTVGTIVSSTQFTITSGLTTGLVENDSVIATQSATHTITFTTASSVVDGSILVIIPASGTTAASNDGFADSGSDASGTQGFDLNSLTAAHVACTGGSPSWGAETITSSASSGSGEHEIIFPFTGTLASAVTVTCTIGGARELINPAPASDHTQGTANDLQITIREYDNNTPSSGVLVDNVDVVVAPIEAVFVSATVDETLSFIISAVNSSTTACGASTDITTTYNAVPFGTLSLNAFKTLAHGLEVSTNASDGYAVTAIEEDQLGKDGVTCTGDAGVANDCIPDTLCDGGSCSHSSADDWETNTNNGFGYSLDSTDGTDAAFEWDATFEGCDGSGTDFCARQFADEENSQSPVTIMSNAGAVNSKNMYVCYRISVGALQPAGYYYTTVRYTATPTF